MAAAGALVARGSDGSSPGDDATGGDRLDLAVVGDSLIEQSRDQLVAHATGAGMTVETWAFGGSAPCDWTDTFEELAAAPPVRLVIPSIGVDIPVVTVGTVKQTAGGQTYEVWDTAANAGAYHKMSAPPGYIGNTVINGHRDIHGKVFADLDKVRLGDPITLYTEEHEFVYTVVEILEVPEKYASAEQRAENQRLIGYIPEERLTLITCTPYGTNLNRLLIIARPAGQAGG